MTSHWRSRPRRGGSVEGRGSVKAWLLAIVHHRAIDALRRRRPASGLPPRDDATASMTLPDVWPEVAGRLLRLEILAALRTLSDVQREAIELAYFGGLTQQEIAQKTGAPPGAGEGRKGLGLAAVRRGPHGTGAD